RVAGKPHGQPAVGALLDVLGLLESELVDVEVEGLVLVEDLDGDAAQLGDHRFASPFLRFDAGDSDARGRPPPRCLQNCSIASRPSPAPPGACPPSGSNWVSPPVH